MRFLRATTRWSLADAHPGRSCHPLPESYNHALFETIVTSLEGNGHEVIATDLYRDGFNPAMSPAERRGYYQMPYDDAAVSSYTPALRRIGGIIFCFPHWC